MLLLGCPIFNSDPAHSDNSPIFYAIKQRNSDILELFCDLGVNKLNFYTTKAGHNPLTLAASIQNWEAVNYLTGRGMLTDVEDYECKTVFVRSL
jgi:ankyrin repeat protein